MFPMKRCDLELNLILGMQWSIAKAPGRPHAARLSVLVSSVILRRTMVHSYWFQIRFVLAIAFSLLALSSRMVPAQVPGRDITQRIERGESFLTNLFDTRLQLLPEYAGS